MNVSAEGYPVIDCSGIMSREQIDQAIESGGVIFVQSRPDTRMILTRPHPWGPTFDLPHARRTLLELRELVAQVERKIAVMEGVHPGAAPAPGMRVK